MYKWNIHKEMFIGHLKNVTQTQERREEETGVIIVLTYLDNA